jgi:D-ribulokinase
MNESMRLSLGIDFGTSGARSVVIDNDRNILWLDNISITATDLALDRLWAETLFQLIKQIPPILSQQISRLAIDGTSGTVLLCDGAGQVLGEPLLYNDDRGKIGLEQVRAIAPPQHPVISATSSFSKLWWYSQQPYFGAARYFLHQADWLAALLHGQRGVSDYHNTLKLGYDVVNLQYPAWLQAMPSFSLLPQVLAPGQPIGQILPALAQQLGLAPQAIVCAGTTDSIAAFAATGADQPGQAVTSLGSTLVLKLLSTEPIERATYGIYSHRWGDLWLVGGASNSGGAVLRHFFTDRELADLSQEIDLQNPTDLDYYPLLRPGERFPINDPELRPKLTPRPAANSQFLAGLLTGIARIEAQGYQLLQQLGASPLTAIYTAGGGAQNLAWQQIRQRQLPVPLLTAIHQDAAYGASLIAQRGTRVAGEPPK